MTTTAREAGRVAVGADGWVAVLVRVLVCVAVAAAVEVLVLVAVAVGATVEVLVPVAEDMRVAVGVLVEEARRVAVRVLVALGGRVAVRVLVAVADAPEGAVAVLVLVALAARVAVRVLVAVRVEVAWAEVAVRLPVLVWVVVRVDVGADEDGEIPPEVVAEAAVVEGSPTPPKPGGMGTNRPGVEGLLPSASGVPKIMPETRGTSVSVAAGAEKLSRSAAGAP